MRHWERASRVGRGIIVTRASVRVCMCIRVTIHRIARARFTCDGNGEGGILPVSFFTHVSFFHV